MKAVKKGFGFKNTKNKSDKINRLRHFSLIYFLILIISFFSFVFLYKIPSLVLTNDKVGYIQKNLRDYALMFLVKDREFSDILYEADTLIGDYKKGINIIKEKKSEIMKLILYFQDNHKKVEDLGVKKYSDFINFTNEFLNFKDDIFSLLGEKGSQKYLVLLQNSSEKRPNGGFFGSYAVVDVDGSEIKFEIFDSYYPNYVGSGVYITGPDYINSFWETNKISFIGANKYGFTDIDGKNIKEVYEKTFTGQSIRGVVFIKSDLLEELLPEFKHKFWEWQFINASVNLIRGKDLPFKKDLYLNDIKKYIEDNKIEMVKNFLQNFGKIKESGNIRIYFTGISDNFDKFLMQNNLNTVYNTGNVYLWDYNRGFNKSDGFVDKSVLLSDMSGHIISATNNDILNVKDLSKGKYKILVSYTMNVPIYYENMMKSLEKKYNISLTDREKHILGLNYLWDNEGIIYFPPSFKILDFNGEYYDFKQVKTPFSNNFVYKVNSKENNQVRNLEIIFKN